MDAIKISYGQHHVPSWNWHVLPGKHEGFTLWGVRGGGGALTLGTVRYELSAGDLFFINYQKEVRGLQDSANPMQVCYVDFILQEPETVATWPEHRHFDQWQFMGELFDRLRTAQQADAFDLKQAWLQAICMEYLAACPAHEDAPYAGKLDQLCRTFQRHPEKRYDIRLLAKDFACTPDHFIRIFKRHDGVTPYAYLQGVRLETAMALLRNSNNRIKEIAGAAGFSNIYEFSRFFRQKTGKSPTAYRAEGKQLRIPLS